MDARTYAGIGASRRRMSVWLAHQGYSELEISTVMTVERLARLHPVPRAPYLPPGLHTAAEDRRG